MSRCIPSRCCVVAIAMAQAADEVKAGDIKVLFVKPLIYWSRFFVLATGFSKPQVGAIAYVAPCFKLFPLRIDKYSGWTSVEILCPFKI